MLEEFRQRYPGLDNRSWFTRLLDRLFGEAELIFWR